MSEELAQIHGDLREVKRALFGDLLRQETGLVKIVESMERTVDEIARTQEEMARMLLIVEELKRSDDEQRLERGRAERNRLSRGAGEMARMMSVMLLVWPALAWDWRALWGGRDLWAPVSVVLGLIAGFALMSILLRRNGVH